MEGGKLEPINPEPRYGYFPRWPEDGDGWIHPEDVTALKGLVPSERVFRRDGSAGPFGVIHYGAVRARVRPALWQETPAPAFEIGDWVEVLSRGQQNEPRTGTVREIFWSPETRGHRYQIDDNGLPIPNFYGAEDLRHVERTEPREEVRVEPHDDGEDLL